MKTYFTAVSIAALTVVLSVVTNAQAPSEETSPSASVPVAIAAPPADDDAPYTLKGGDNEFGGWGGFSFKATTIFAGLSEAEADDRKFLLAAFRYGRTLYANDSIALQYTLDAIPVAVATGVITSRSSVGGVTVFQRDTAYGGGLSPLGFQLEFANGSRVHPFAHLNAGFLGFAQIVQHIRAQPWLRRGATTTLIDQFVRRV